MRLLPLLISVSLLSGCSALDLVVPQYYKSDVAVRARQADEQRVADFNSGNLTLTPAPVIAQPTKHLQSVEQVEAENNVENCSMVARMVSLVSVLRDQGISPLDTASRIHVQHDYPLDPILREAYLNPGKTPAQAQMAAMVHCTTIGYVAMREELIRKDEDHMVASILNIRKDILALKIAKKLSYNN